jgi:hypothetical protein
MNAEKASQTVLLLKPESAHSIARVGALNLLADISVGPNNVHGASAAVTATPIRPIAGPGRDSRTNPKTTAMKMAKKYQACWARPSGAGTIATTVAAMIGTTVLATFFIGTPKDEMIASRSPELAAE